jgi:hypothetical protein
MIFQLYRGSQFCWWRKTEYPEKTIDIPQVTDKLYHMMIPREMLEHTGEHSLYINQLMMESLSMTLVTINHHDF